MFYHVRGPLIYRDAATAVVECGGVGYKATVSRLTSDALTDKMNKEVRLFTHLTVREDGVELFGFGTEDELSAFKLLIGVSGVGPKAAMAVLSLFTPERLAAAVMAGDAKALAKAQNVGAKTAARIVLELQDKMGGFAAGVSDFDALSTMPAAPTAKPTGKAAEAADALSVLGYGRTEIADALKNVDTTQPLEAIITAALRYFSK